MTQSLLIPLTTSQAEIVDPLISGFVFDVHRQCGGERGRDRSRHRPKSGPCSLTVDRTDPTGSARAPRFASKRWAATHLERSISPRFSFAHFNHPTPHARSGISCRSRFSLYTLVYLFSYFTRDCGSWDHAGYKLPLVTQPPPTRSRTPRSFFVFNFLGPPFLAPPTFKKGPVEHRQFSVLSIQTCLH